MHAADTHSAYALFDNIPEELKSWAQWVVWKFEDHGKPKLDKVPYDPRTGQRAKSNDSTTWGTFAEALAAYQSSGFGGVGFVFSEHDPYAGLDLDSCRNPETGQLEQGAGEIVERLDSYTEASPSGTGVHIIVKGKLPPEGRKKGKVEMYDSGRFFTMTAEHIGGTPTLIEHRQVELGTLHASIFGAKEHTRQTNANGNGKAHSVSDEEIFSLVKRAKNGALFSQLFAGDWTGYPSQSEADLAFCNLLAFWCGGDPARIDQLFRQSGLYRTKWDEKHFNNGKTYGEATIEKAVTGAREFYTKESRAAESHAHTNTHAQSQHEPWPVLADEALHGLAGDIVRAIAPHTEGDPVAVLLNTMIAFGNCINGAPHAVVGKDKHPGKLDVLFVGDTSKGRKGTAWSIPRYLFSLADPDWARDCIKSGLSSAEGLIYNVRDAVYKKQPVKEKGRVVDYESVMIEEAVGDKRLLIVEPEFASTLTVMNREGNTLSAVIRDAWDSGNLATLTKNSPLKATNAHISIIGHITRQELLARMDDTSKANGFANRFLFALVRRSQELPEGGAVPESDLQRLAEHLSRILRFSRSISLVQREEEARALWASVYHDLSEGKPGMIGSIIARAEAHVLRLSLLYALLDESRVIKMEHLKAALALWDYCEKSAVLIFGERLGDPTADRILEAIRSAGAEGLTDNDLYELFGRHKPANERGRAIDLLLSLDLIVAVQEETGGRPRMRYTVA